MAAVRIVARHLTVAKAAIEVVALFTFAVDLLLCSDLRGASWTACNFSI